MKFRTKITVKEDKAYDSHITIIQLRWKKCKYFTRIAYYRIQIDEFLISINKIVIFYFYFFNICLIFSETKTVIILLLFTLLQCYLHSFFLSSLNNIAIHINMAY